MVSCFVSSLLIKIQCINNTIKFSLNVHSLYFPMTNILSFILTQPYDNTRWLFHYELSLGAFPLCFDKITIIYRCLKLRRIHIWLQLHIYTNCNWEFHLMPAHNIPSFTEISRRHIILFNIRWQSYSTAHLNEIHKFMDYRTSVTYLQYIC